MSSATITATLTVIPTITRSKYYCVWTSALAEKYSSCRSTVARYIIIRLGALCLGMWYWLHKGSLFPQRRGFLKASLPRKGQKQEAKGGEKGSLDLEADSTAFKFQFLLQHVTWLYVNTSHFQALGSVSVYLLGLPWSSNKMMNGKSLGKLLLITSQMHLLSNN